MSTEPEPEETCNDDVIECPYCHYMHRDVCDFLDDESKIQCHQCERDFLYRRTVAVYYTGYPIQ